jgi:hypothetical protein
VAVVRGDGGGRGVSGPFTGSGFVVKFIASDLITSG